MFGAKDARDAIAVMAEQRETICKNRENGSPGGERSRYDLPGWYFHPYSNGRHFRRASICLLLVQLLS